MATKTISGRQLRHGAPEEGLSPGEAVWVKKRDGKIFELRRVDSGRRDILADVEQIQGIGESSTFIGTFVVTFVAGSVCAGEFDKGVDQGCDQGFRES